MAQDEMTVTLQVARQALAENRADDAIVLLQGAFESRPDSAEIASLLGVAYAGKKEIDTALDWFGKAVAIQPTARIYFNLAKLHNMRNSPYEAKIALQEAL